MKMNQVKVHWVACIIKVRNLGGGDNDLTGDKLIAVGEVALLVNQMKIPTRKERCGSQSLMCEQLDRYKRP